MGRIPQVSRGRLASSVVGTPGVDRSEEAIFGQVAQVSGEFAASQRRQDAKIQQTSDVINSNSQLVDFDNELEVLSRENLSFEDYTKLANDRFTTRMKNLKSPQAREFFSNKGRALLLGKNDRVAARNRKTTVLQAASELENISEKISRNVSDVFSDPEADIEEKMETFFDSAELLGVSIIEAQGLLSPEEHQKFKDGANEAIVMAAVRGLLDANPDQVEGFLNQDVIKDLVPNPEKIIKDAKEIVTARVELNKSIKNEERFNTENDFGNRLAANEIVPESEIEAALVDKTLSKSFAKTLRDYKKSSRKVFSGDNPQTMAELTEQYLALGVVKSSSKARQRKIDLKTMTFDQTALFRQRILEAMESGDLSQSTGVRWLNRITPKFNEGVADMVKQVTKEQDGFLYGTNVVEAITTKGEVAEAKGTFISELMRRIDIEENKGARISKDKVDEISADLVEEFKTSFNPNNKKYKVGDIHTIAGIEVKIVAIRIDGEPILNTNLDAPISRIPRPIGK